MSLLFDQQFLDILKEQVVHDYKNLINNSEDSRIVLTENDPNAKLTELTITIEEPHIVLRVDDIQFNQIFKERNKQNKIPASQNRRSDYIIITTNKIYIIELKPQTSKEKVVKQKLKATKCLLKYFYIIYQEFFPELISKTLNLGEIINKINDSISILCAHSSESGQNIISSSETTDRNNRQKIQKYAMNDTTIKNYLHFLTANKKKYKLSWIETHSKPLIL